MNKPNEVSHKGITVRIGKRTTIVNGKRYSNWEVREHTSGKLVRHKRASFQAADVTNLIGMAVQIGELTKR